MMALIKKLSVSIFIGLVIGGCVLFVYSGMELGYLISWQSVGKPPEQAVKIVGTAMDTVTVQTLSGKNYQCNFLFKDKCWMETTGTFSLDPCSTQSFELPKPLSNTVDLARACSYSYSGISETVYALRDDGEIYVWHGRIGGGDEVKALGYVFFPLIGFLLGFLGAWIFIFFRWLTRLP